MLKRLFYLPCILSSFILQVDAQSILGSINIKEEFDVESIRKGDSVLMVINRTTGYYNNKPKVESDVFWVTDTGIGQPSRITKSNDDNLVGLDANADGHLF